MAMPGRQEHVPAVNREKTRAFVLVGSTFSDGPTTATVIDVKKGLFTTSVTIDFGDGFPSVLPFNGRPTIKDVASALGMTYCVDTESLITR
jgi:hypothetical protein